MKISLQTIFDAQIEKFKDLKAQYDNIEEKKRNFNYDEQLSILQNNMQDSIEEISNSEKLSDEIKESTIEAIKGEFQKKKEKLDKEMNGFNDELGLIDLQRAELREDPKYIEAMTARRDRIQSKNKSKQMKKRKEEADSDYKASQSAYENAKSILEKKKNEMEKAESTLLESDKAYTESLNDENTKYKSYHKEIEQVISGNEIKDRVTGAVNYFIKNGITIDLSEIKNRSLSDIVKYRIYHKSGISTLGHKINKIDDDILQIDNIDPSIKIDAGSTFHIYCCYDDGKGGEIEVKISGDNSGNSVSKGGKEEPVKPSMVQKKRSKDKSGGVETLDTMQAMDEVKTYFMNRKHKGKNHFLEMLKRAATEPDFQDKEFLGILKDLATIHHLYNHKEQTLELIFDLSNLRLLPDNKIKQFILCAKEKAVEHGKKKQKFNEVYNTIIVLRDDTEGLEGREKRNFGLGLVNYICIAFGLNMEKDVGISDVTRSGMLSGGTCSGNRVRRKFQ